MAVVTRTCPHEPVREQVHAAVAVAVKVHLDDDDDQVHAYVATS